jgi:hypothetical protein
MAEEKRRRGLASGFSNYINAEDEEGKKAALAQIAQNDPSAYVNLIKANKETTFGLGSAKGEYAYLTAMEQDPTIPEDLKVGIRKRKEVLEKAPIVSYTNAYGQQVGKQDAEAGLEPSYGYGTPVYTRPVIQQPIQGGDVLAHVPVREKPIQGEQPQAMPMQAQLMPRGRVTAAQLKAAEKEAVKLAENRIERENTDTDLERKKPALKEALRKALIASRSGKGIGVVEGYATKFGVNPNAWFDKKYSQNYGDIENAGRLINQYVRQSLKNAGLTGKELDSAAEANRYLYELNPTNNEQIIESRIINFINDYMPELLEEEGFVTNQNSTNNAYKEKYGLE